MEAVLRELRSGNTDYASLRPDVWKQSHPEYVRTYRAEERRDRVELKRYHRAERRLVVTP